MFERIGMSTNCYHGPSLDQIFQGISRAGFKYVELASIPGYAMHVDPEKMSQQEIEDLKDKMRKYNLLPLSISGHVDMTSSEGLEQLKKRIDLANKLGIQFVHTGTGDTSSPEKIDAFYKNIRIALEFAKTRNVIINLEPHGEFSGTGKKIISILERIDHPNIGLNYDTANVIFYAGVRPEEDIKNVLDKITHLHLKDHIGGKGVYTFPALGDGDVNFFLIFSLLRDANYQGPISVEIEFDGQGKESLEEVNAAIKKSYEYLSKVISKVV